VSIVPTGAAAAPESQPRSGEDDVPEEVGAPADHAGRPSIGVRLTSLGLIVLTVLCGVTLILGFINKDRCTGPRFDQYGRSQPDFDKRRYQDVCYSDIQTLWIGRDIDRHVFPYVHGKLTDDGQPVGGVVEYPVLTGVFIWASAIFAHTDADFLLYSALLLAPFGLATAWLLGRMSGWRALLWAIGPPLVLYAFHNWELPVVLCATAAFYVVHHGWGKRGAARPLLTRATVAAVLLGVGFAFKVYPAIFTVPFMIAGFDGWRASFTFQLLRKADITTNSIWFWGFRPDSDPDNVPVQELIGVLSPLLMLISFVVACAFGWVRYQKSGTYPWVAVSAAMLCGFLLLHKVHSPQYTLWLIPMFVLLRVRWGWIVAYFAADLAMGIGIFRWYYEIFYGKHGGIFDGLAAQAVMVGVWGRAALLIGLFCAFLTTRETFRERLTV
jgi:hypothetical protein